MKKRVLISVFLLIALAIMGYHCYCHYMVRQFYKCVDEGNTEEIIACVKKMPDVNMPDVCIPEYYIRRILFQGALDKGYPIYYAVWKQADINVMEALLEKGADLNKEDYDLPLECLLRYEQEDMYAKVKLFVEYGADINVEFVRIPGYWEQLSEKEKEERINTVIYLWECGIDEWEYVGTEFEKTLLHDAAERIEADYLEILYQNEKRPMYGLLNEKDANGESPLFYAVRANHPGNCEFLINEGADVSIKNNEGKTAYDIAVELDNEECIEILENHGRIIRVDGWDMEYTISERKLVVEDFENIELGSSLDEIENKLRKPDGWVGGGILLPVYVLEDNSAVELVFRNDVTNEDLEAIYLYKGQKEFVLKKR